MSTDDPEMLDPLAPTESEVDEWFDEEDEDTEAEDPAPTPPEKSIEEKYADSQIRVVRSNMDFSLHMLKESASSNSWINRSPDYQRRHRWDSRKRSQLIESILMNIPIPPIFLYENEYNQYEVMDGRQRLDTTIEFLEDRFKLRGLEFWKELNGKSYKSLPPLIQRGLLRRTMSAIVLLAETRRSSSAEEQDIRMIMFRRLNTGGAALNPQELRNALYQSKFNKEIRNLARSPTFAKVWGIPHVVVAEGESVPPELSRNVLYKTMADCELVLRFFAIRETIQMGLRAPLRRLLDDCLKRHEADTEEQVNALSALFSQCLSTLNDVFDDKPFRLPEGRVSRPLYDALMVAYSMNPAPDVIQRKGAIQGALRRALADRREYNVLIGRGNTVDSIIDRVELAQRILAVS